jgi:hypothetical protein
LRVDRSVVVRDAGIVDVLTDGGFEVNKASAAWRALQLRATLTDPEHGAGADLHVLVQSPSESDSAVLTVARH